MRIFAIINWWKDREESVKNELIEKLHLGEKDKVLVFCNEANGEKEGWGPVEFVPVSKEGPGKNRASIKNYVYKYVKEKYTEPNTYLYMIEDSVQILKNPQEFFDSVEDLMEIFDLDVWFNTYLDICNRIFSKFQGRSNITIDKEHYGVQKKIILTSHCNPTVSVYALDRVKYETLFDEDFTIPMYFILEFLGRRKKDAVHPLVFLNNYITIPEEIGVFKEENFKTDPINRDVQMAEHKRFMDMKLNMEPDNDLDKILDKFTDFLLEKYKKN